MVPSIVSSYRLTMSQPPVVSKTSSSVNEAVESNPSKSNDKEGALNVRRSFRSFASALIVAARQAEKVAAASGSDEPVPDKTTKEAVEMILKQRQAVWHFFRPIHYVVIISSIYRHISFPI